MIDEKIKLIDSLLEDDSKLDKYINSIEDKNIDTPKDLNENIRKLVIKKINRKSKKLFEILQIAACTVFALVLWEIVSLNPESNRTYQSRQKLYNAKEQIQGVVNNFSDLLMKPSDFKGGEK